MALQQPFMPPGPAAGHHAPPVPDLSVIFDLDEQWPDPEQCPDWPLLDEVSARFSTVGGPTDAKARLATLERALRRGESGYRAPTDEERVELQREHFRQGNPLNWRWARLGFQAQPANNISSPAEMIVEATHIRGYLRKLGHRANAAKDNAEREKRARLQRTIDDYEPAKQRMETELAGLAEAEARHRQRLEDETAFHRCKDLRGALRDHDFNFGQARSALAVMSPSLQGGPDA